MNQSAGCEDFHSPPIGLKKGPQVTFSVVFIPQAVDPLSMVLSFLPPDWVCISYIPGKQNLIGFRLGS
jgi:hypothetical protein